MKRWSYMIGLASVGMVIGAGIASASPDPHIPNLKDLYCPGGGMGGEAFGLGYCDGIPYPDGSYWHILQGGNPIVGHPQGLAGQPMQCVINPDGGFMPQPAPPGGCGGAV